VIIRPYMSGSKFLTRIHEISQKAKLKDVAVAIYDYETALQFSYQGERVFHAASTFKSAVLFALFKAAQSGRVKLEDRLHVRNRFVSIVDGSPYRIERERDGDAAVHKAVGRAMRLVDLGHAMITRSSNLATNLLMDFLTLEFIRETLSDAGLAGIEVRRGVEDQIAFEKSISNETTADGLLKLYRIFEERRELQGDLAERAIEIFLAQEFNSMIPARLPAGVKVAHKTGEISNFCHDAGIVYPPDRKPYVITILTETGPETEKRTRAVADLSHAAHRFLCGTHREEKAHE
jgi:beta-lactamase class A